MKIDESSVIFGLQNGEEWAYRYLYDNHYQVMCFIAAQYLHDDFTAESVVTDIITHLWESKDNLNIATNSLRKYLIKCVRNKCLDYIKSKYHQKEIPISSISNNSGKDIRIDEDALGCLLEDELENEIHLAIENLPQNCRRIFHMSRIEGMTREEIAKKLNISVNTVKYHLKNALSLLHRSLGKYLILIIAVYYFLQAFHYPQ